ncbi:small G protein signaling modulator 3 homolog isoform X2 [Octopus bimaculoides]|uniref:small G protein signaling modulator 3 homolog isoform X2 n=1 Tax=Octopus bimaculoides TaxID=37653 RepID=UPI0022DFDDE4|nr:small G protein signaling modulator 3 homolog isoform X2 [Octopus bimaculoides]
MCVSDTLSEDEDDYIVRETGEGVSVCAVPSYNHNSDFTPTPGGPFSALTPSMWPQDILSRLNNPPVDAKGQLDYRYDEFGFKVEEEDGPEENSSKLLSTPFIEDPQHRLKWTAYLEFTHNNEVGDLTWDKVEDRLPRSEKFRQMIRQGIPHSLRPQIWMRVSGALEKKHKSDMSYKEVVKESSNDHLMTSKQIEKDLLRTMPSNACFCNINSTGIPRLRRILRGLAWLYPDVGYCQGTGMIAASLLLFMEEEDTFWMLCSIIEDLLPASYYSSTLIGIQADQRVLRQLLITLLSNTDLVLKEHDIELSLISLHWFLTLFASVVHMKVLLRIWDLLFYQGSIVLFQVTMGMLKMKEEEMLTFDNSAQIFNALSDVPGDVQDVDKLIEISFNVAGSLTDTIVDTHRRKHLAYLMADQGAIVNPESAKNLPKQQLNKRHLRRSRSLVSLLLWGNEEEEDLGKAKNIRQTELLVDLRDAILQVARHFQSVDPKNNKIINTADNQSSYWMRKSLSSDDDESYRMNHDAIKSHLNQEEFQHPRFQEFQLANAVGINTHYRADYSMESHARDLENYVNVARNRRRRAKALLDFERHDDDELGFRKNDIITIISQKDEHCWVGELNGLRGWFPAKFVELLDERSKNYSSAGDDSVTEAITDIVRGTLCPALKAVFEHGLKRSSILGGSCHPWLFIEEAATREVEKDFQSVYSRLVLCKTYRLDEDGKVLTPEEILYRAVQAVNLGHDQCHAQMDVKFRSIICCGLNEQVLHLWLETLCSCLDVVEKWYHPWSFIRSPGWVQIKCELRILSQFAFNLSLDWELPKKKVPPDGLREGVRDMLIKHHLFSWDL